MKKERKVLKVFLTVVEEVVRKEREFSLTKRF